jgi:hypothetical protein
VFYEADHIGRLRLLPGNDGLAAGLPWLKKPIQDNVVAGLV